MFVSDSLRPANVVRGGLTSKIEIEEGLFDIHLLGDHIIHDCCLINSTLHNDFRFAMYNALSCIEGLRSRRSENTRGDKFGKIFNILF